MRRVRNVRYLAKEEIKIAMDVFRNTIPYSKVVVSDGLGAHDRPFTLPTSMPVSMLFNVKDGKYVIHAGDDYLGMSNEYDKEGQKTLIHELTHVWQGEHSGRSWNYVFDSGWSQLLLDDAYKYEPKRLEPWDDYNVEQQAHIVEDWFAHGMKEEEEEDRRFYYIKRHIRGEQVDHDWIRAQWTIHGIEKSTLDVPSAYGMDRDSLDRYLLPILEERFRANDVSGFRGRVKKLEEFFTTLQAATAQQLLTRLKARHRGDKVADYFHAYLATESRNTLMGILRKK